MLAKRVCKNFGIKLGIKLKLGEYHGCTLKVIHYFWVKFSKTSENLFKNISSRSGNFFFQLTD